MHLRIPVRRSHPIRQTLRRLIFVQHVRARRHIACLPLLRQPRRRNMPPSLKIPRLLPDLNEISRRRTRVIRYPSPALQRHQILRIIQRAVRRPSLPRPLLIPKIARLLHRLHFGIFAKYRIQHPAAGPRNRQSRSTLLLFHRWIRLGHRIRSVKGLHRILRPIPNIHVRRLQYPPVTVIRRRNKLHRRRRIRHHPVQIFPVRLHLQIQRFRLQNLCLTRATLRIRRRLRFNPGLPLRHRAGKHAIARLRIKEQVHLLALHRGCRPIAPRHQLRPTGPVQLLHVPVFGVPNLRHRSRKVQLPPRPLVMPHHLRSFHPIQALLAVRVFL